MIQSSRCFVIRSLMSFWLLAVLSGFRAGNAQADWAWWYSQYPLVQGETATLIEPRPELVVAADGVATALWLSQYRRQNLEFSRVNAARQVNGVWQAPTLLNIEADYAAAPQLVIDSQGGVTAAWLGYDRSALMMAHWTDGGWSAPAKVYAACRGCRDLTLAADAGAGFWLAWIGLGADDLEHLHVARWDGAVIGAVTVIERSHLTDWQNDTLTSPVMAADGAGNAMLAWQALNPNGSPRIEAVRYDAGSNKWEATATPHNTSSAAKELQIAAGEDHSMTLLWLDDRINTLRWAGKWKTITRIAGNSQQTPRLVANSLGKTLAVWSVCPVTQTGCRVQASWLNGEVWSQAATVSAAGKNSVDPRVALDASGEATVTMSSWGGKVGDGQSTHLMQGSHYQAGAWSAPVDLSEDLRAKGQLLLDHTLAANPAGDVSTLWTVNAPAAYDSFSIIGKYGSRKADPSPKPEPEPEPKPEPKPDPNPTPPPTPEPEPAPEVLPVYPQPNVTLAVNRRGTGTVTSSPPGIQCGPRCGYPFTTGMRVSLTASPGRGYVFKGWSGACSGRKASCVVTLRKSRWVKANFVPGFGKVEWEPNDVPAEATVVRTGRPMAGQLGSEEDVDWFRYRVGRGPSQTKAIFQCVGGEDGYDLSWISPTGVTQTEYSITPDQCGSKFKIPLATPMMGDYHLVVAPMNIAPFNNSQYSLRIGALPFVNCTPCPCDKTAVMVPIPVTRENCGNQPLVTCKPTKLECQ